MPGRIRDRYQGRIGKVGKRHLLDHPCQTVGEDTNFDPMGTIRCVLETRLEPTPGVSERKITEVVNVLGYELEDSQKEVNGSEICQNCISANAPNVR